MFLTLINRHHHQIYTLKVVKCFDLTNCNMRTLTKNLARHYLCEGQSIQDQIPSRIIQSLHTRSNVTIRKARRRRKRFVKKNGKHVGGDSKEMEVAKWPKQMARPA